MYVDVPRLPTLPPPFTPSLFAQGGLDIRKCWGFFSGLRQEGAYISVAMDKVIFSNHKPLTFEAIIAAVIMLFFINESVFWHAFTERPVCKVF